MVPTGGVGHDGAVGDVTEHEAEQVDRANESGRQAVVFVHGLRLLPSSWDRWRGVFEEAGYAALAPGWPDDPDTVEEAHANPEIFAHSASRVRLKRSTLPLVWVGRAGFGSVGPRGRATRCC